MFTKTELSVILRALVAFQKSADRAVNRKDAPEGVVNEFRKFSLEITQLYNKAQIEHVKLK